MSQHRIHLLDTERQLGHDDGVEAIRRELRPLLAAADPDFTPRLAIE